MDPEIPDAAHRRPQPVGPRLVVAVSVAVLTGGVGALIAVASSGSIGPGRLAQTGPQPGPLALALGVETLVGLAILLLSPRVGAYDDDSPVRDELPAFSLPARAHEPFDRDQHMTGPRPPPPSRAAESPRKPGRAPTASRTPTTAGPGHPPTTRCASASAPRGRTTNPTAPAERTPPTHLRRLSACSRSPSSSPAPARTSAPCSRRLRPPTSPRAWSWSVPTARRRLRPRRALRHPELPRRVRRVRLARGVGSGARRAAVRVAARPRRAQRPHAPAAGRPRRRVGAAHHQHPTPPTCPSSRRARRPRCAGRRCDADGGERDRRRLRVDTGPILAQERIPVLPDDTEDTLHERIKPVERRLLIDVVRRIAEGELDLAAAASRTA